MLAEDTPKPKQRKITQTETSLEGEHSYGEESSEMLTEGEEEEEELEESRSIMGRG